VKDRLFSCNMRIIMSASLFFFLAYLYIILDLCRERQRERERERETSERVYLSSKRSTRVGAFAFSCHLRTEEELVSEMMCFNFEVQQKSVAELLTLSPKPTKFNTACSIFKVELFN